MTAGNSNERANAVTIISALILLAEKVIAP